MALVCSVWTVLWTILCLVILWVGSDPVLWFRISILVLSSILPHYVARVVSSASWNSVPMSIVQYLLGRSSKWILGHVTLSILPLHGNVGTFCPRTHGLQLCNLRTKSDLSSAHYNPSSRDFSRMFRTILHLDGTAPQNVVLVVDTSGISSAPAGISSRIPVFRLS